MTQTVKILNLADKWVAQKDIFPFEPPLSLPASRMGKPMRDNEKWQNSGTNKEKLMAQISKFLKGTTKVERTKVGKETGVSKEPQKVAQPHVQQKSGTKSESGIGTNVVTTDSRSLNTIIVLDRIHHRGKFH